MPADFNTAVQQFEAGRHADAAATCRSLLKANPDDLSASNMLGVIAATLGEFQQAATCFRAYAEAAPNDVGVATNLAQSMLEIAEHEEALSHFRRAARCKVRMTPGLKRLSARIWIPGGPKPGGDMLLLLTTSALKPDIGGLSATGISIFERLQT